MSFIVLWCLLLHSRSSMHFPLPTYVPPLSTFADDGGRERDDWHASLLFLSFFCAIVVRIHISNISLFSYRIAHACTTFVHPSSHSPLDLRLLLLSKSSWLQMYLLPPILLLLLPYVRVRYFLSYMARELSSFLWLSAAPGESKYFDSRPLTPLLRKRASFSFCSVASDACF